MGVERRGDDLRLPWKSNPAATLPTPFIHTTINPNNARRRILSFLLFAGSPTFTGARLCTWRAGSSSISRRSVGGVGRKGRRLGGVVLLPACLHARPSVRARVLFGPWWQGKGALGPSVRLVPKSPKPNNIPNNTQQPPTKTPTKRPAQVYLQFFLLDALGLGDRELALVPLTLYLAGLGATLATEPLNDRLGRKLTYLAGTVFFCFVLICLLVFLNVQGAFFCCFVCMHKGIDLGRVGGCASVVPLLHR